MKKQPKVFTDFTFDPETHICRIGKIEIPTVTQLLQEFGLIDFSKVPEERLEYKRQIGIQTHHATALHDLNRLDENSVHPDIAPFILAYIKFRQVTKFEPEIEFIEKRLVSKKNRFGGGLDRIGSLDGKRVLIDLKCTWDMYPSTGPQTAGYDILVRENFGIKVQKRMGVLLKENQNFSITEFNDPEDHQTILSCNYLHHRKKRLY